MRKPLALCAALAVAAFSFVASEAAEVRIGDFVFGCKTSDGQVRKPQFGDMNGVFYTDIRRQEKACRDTVKRMIANCHQHTRFLSPGDNSKYPECLPVFRKQAAECAAFFREEIARCTGAGGSGQKVAIKTEPNCAGLYDGAECWWEIANQPGCYIWTGNYRPRLQVTWAGMCTSGVASGPGQLRWSGSRTEHTGKLVKGKLHGRWVAREGTACEVVQYDNGSFVSSSRC